MSKYELIYFHGRGRAETARYLFALAGVKYTDRRVNGEEYQKMQPDVLFSGLPELKVDDFHLCQSATIQRYLAREFGLMGSSKKEEFTIDMIAQCIDDITEALIPVFTEKDEARKAALTAKFVERLQTFLSKLEKMLSANNGGTGWFVGNKPTLADAHAANILCWLSGPAEEELKKYAKLTAHRQRFFAEPRIAEWIKNRPKSDF